jgi:hypothetical protein
MPLRTESRLNQFIKILSPLIYKEERKKDSVAHPPKETSCKLTGMNNDNRNKKLINPTREGFY